MAIPIPTRQLFINGNWTEPLLKKRIPIINPSTEEIIGDIPSATAEDVDVAVEAARKALSRNKGKDWSSASGAVRAKYLRAIAAKIKERKPVLAKLETIDCGKPLNESEADMDDVIMCFEYYADLAEGLDAKQNAPLPLPMKAFKSYVIKEPIGVVGLIVPWNYPLLMAIWKVAPALAAGCAAVLKPSELASVTCLELGEVCKEVDLPPGVLNILPGLGPEAGAPLASHPHVDKIAFTGSTTTAIKIMTAAAQRVKLGTVEDHLQRTRQGLLIRGTTISNKRGKNQIKEKGRSAIHGNLSCLLNKHQPHTKRTRALKTLTKPKKEKNTQQHLAKPLGERREEDTPHILSRLGFKPVTLELGGKGPIVVFEDVDIDKAVEWTIVGCFYTNGQICSATSRLIVHESIAAKFLDRLVKWSENIKISDPLEEGCRLGPIVSREQYEKVIKFISNAKSEGATILYGGNRPKHLEKGFYVEPTIITDVKTTTQIWREEVFGPVLCVKTFTTEDEAIELANDTHYGLGGAVVSKDLERCDRVSKAMQSGAIWVNCSQPCFCQAPFGGIKWSGFGRELGEWGLENFMSVKQVTQYVSDEQWGWYQAPKQ